MSKTNETKAPASLPASAGFKLQPAKLIRAQQDTIAKTGVQLMAAIRANADQCLAHFQKHGDITLAERLIASVPRGIVVAGLAKWFKDFAPVSFDKEGKATVTGPKEDTKLDEAIQKDWTGDVQVMARATNPIEPINFKWIQSRIASLKSQLKKAAEQGGRGIGVMSDDGHLVPYNDEQKAQLEDYITRLAALPVAGLKATPAAEPAKLIKGKAKRVVKSLKDLTPEVIEPPLAKVG